MKKIPFVPHQIALAFGLLASTVSFGQREERHEARPQTQNAPAQQRSQPSFQRPAMQQPAQQRPAFQQPRSAFQPSAQQRPAFNNNTRSSFNQPPQNRPVQPVTAQRSFDRSPNSPVAQRAGNPGYRTGYDNRLAVNNNIRTNNYGYNNNRGSYGRTYSRNYVRPHYTRPPFVYGGHNFYTRFNYNYHPYRPYYYGSFFHPFGFFIGGLSAAAFELSWANQAYWYDQGVYYAPYNGGYQVVPAPAGAYINNLPNGYATVSVGDQNFYYFAGTFYAPGANGFEIVDAPPGAVVYDLPEGAKEVKQGDITYLEYNNAYYQPITLDGRDAYEVVDMEDANNNQ